MTVQLAPDLGAWLVLRRVQWDGVTLDPAGTLYDRSQRLPAFLTPHVFQLADRGYVRLGWPVPEWLCRRRVRITMAGEHLLDQLYDLRRCWVAQRRAGLPRCRIDLDSLAGRSTGFAGCPHATQEGGDRSWTPTNRPGCWASSPVACTRSLTQTPLWCSAACP